MLLLVDVAADPQVTSMTALSNFYLRSLVKESFIVALNDVHEPDELLCLIGPVLVGSSHLLICTKSDSKKTLCWASSTLSIHAILSVIVSTMIYCTMLLVHAMFIISLGVSMRTKSFFIATCNHWVWHRQLAFAVGVSVIRRHASCCP
jgi:hypothetical protein